jgi:hypothetical protein
MAVVCETLVVGWCYVQRAAYILQALLVLSSGQLLVSKLVSMQGL